MLLAWGVLIAMALPFLLRPHAGGPAPQSDVGSLQ
jgi:hypothetical protein